jgi:septation ring formation regulator EzrA
VPREVLERTMAQVPKSIATLQQSVDFVAELHNLKTGKVELTTEGLDWTMFRNAWTQTCSAVKAKL